VPSKQRQAFIIFCHELRHGEIQVLKIQDGIPVLAEKDSNASLAFRKGYMSPEQVRAKELDARSDL